MSHPSVLRFGRNTRGRDFVIGDLHGAYGLLRQALAAVRYDELHDRLFSVGDLIDRGPDSADVLEVLALPGFHAIRGNHEQMLLDTINDFGIDTTVLTPIHLRNGMGWWLETPIERRRAIAAATARLPVVMEVATERGTVGLVHADVPSSMDWTRFVAAIERGEEEAVQCALWSRRRVEQDDDRGVAGIDRVFVGHTPMRAGVQRLGNVYFVDTGAVFGAYGNATGAGLTMANLMASTQKLAGTRPGLHLLNTIDEALPDAPFSRYAVS